RHTRCYRDWSSDVCSSDLELSTAFALAVPRPETEEITPYLAFFQRAAAMIRKRLVEDGGRGGGHARQRDIDAAVRQVIGGAVDRSEERRVGGGCRSSDVSA